MAQSQEVQASLAIWRHKVNEGTLTLDEMTEAIKLMRGDRKNSAVSPEAAKRTKAKKEVKSADDLLAELENFGK